MILADDESCEYIEHELSLGIEEYWLVESLVTLDNLKLLL